MTFPSGDQALGLAATRPRPGHSRTSGWWAATFVAALGLYLATMAPGVLWGDSGDAQLRVLSGAWSDTRDLARSHVTYYAAARLVHRLFEADAAWSANLIAAIAGAGTVANMAVLIGQFIGNLWARLAGILLLLLSHTLWQLSTGAEVVTLSTFLLSLELVLAVRWLGSGRGPLLIGLAAINGLGFSTHNLALLTWPACGLLLWMRREQVRAAGWRTLTAAVVAWLVGASPLLVLAVKEYVNLGDAVATLRSLLVGIYAQEVFHHRVSGPMALNVLGYIVLNFPTPLLLLAPWGWWRLRRSASSAGWWYLTTAGATYLVFGARYRVPDQYTFLVHAYLLLVLFAAVGAQELIARRPFAGFGLILVACSLLGPVVYALAPRVVQGQTALQKLLPGRELAHRDPATWFLQPWRCGYDEPARFGRKVLELLPPDAILFADSTSRQPINYVQEASRIRPDVQISAGVRLTPRKLRRIDEHNAVECVDQGVVYTVSNERAYMPNWLYDMGFGFEQHNLVYRVTRDREQEAQPLQ